jgi:septum site-determining protein MinC
VLPAEEAAPAPPLPASPATTVTVTQPVRSGQQVIAPHGDLVVLSSVNAGAEVFAAGSIHVYGALRGRALAGIDGDTSARVYSLQFNPELVAVAGEYLVNESLSKRIQNRSVSVSLVDGVLRCQPLGTFTQD